jgi:hypothetical protein
MAYGLRGRAPNENTPSQLATHRRQPAAEASSWRLLSEANRLALIEWALGPANEPCDGCPAA